MEGKEARFGIVNSALWATATTAASNGSVNAMHDSFTPLGGLVPMWLMQLGEVIFGGVGSGLYGMLVFAIVAVFVAGLMIGRTPEYLGKKIEAFEMKMAAVAILVPPLVVLVGAAVAVVVDAGVAGIANPGAHGFSEILYAFSSAGNNNGSAFAGLSANTPFYNALLGLAMLMARYWLVDSGAGHRRLAGGQEDRPRLGRHAAHPHPAVRAAVDRQRDRCRRADLLAGAGARAGGRTVADARRALRNIAMKKNTFPVRFAICCKPRHGMRSSACRRATRLKNPVMFVVWLGSLLTSGLFIQALVGQGEARRTPGFILAITLWLWFTVLFANFAEAMAEGRGKAQAAALKALQKDRVCQEAAGTRVRPPMEHGYRQPTCARGDWCWSRPATLIPGDGEVIEGVASVDESAITGESAPVIRESGGDFSAVTGGTRVLSDWLVVRISVNPGETFLDRMIAHGGGRETPEDAQRDRPDHPAGGADPDLPAGHRDAAAVLALQRAAAGSGAGHASPC